MINILNFLCSFSVEIYLFSIFILALFSTIENYNLQRNTNFKAKLLNNSSNLALFLGLATLASLFLLKRELLWNELVNPLSNSYYYASYEFTSNYFLLSAKALALLMTGLCLICSSTYMKHNNIQRPEYPLFMLSALLGTLLIISSNNLLYIYLSLELLNFSIYLLIASKPFSSKSNEAALRYFVYSSFISAVFLLGLSLLYGLFGTLNLSDLSTLIIACDYLNESFGFQSKMTYYLALTFIISTLLFKMGLVPFHFWVPEVYAGSPLTTTLFLATVPKIAIFGLLVKIFLTLCINHPIAFLSLKFISLVSILYATLKLIYEYDAKRFLAYSTIANMGFVTLAFSLLSIQGFEASIAYFTVYIVTSAILFIIIIQLSPSTASSKNSPVTFEIQQIFNFCEYNKHVIYSIYLLIILLSLAGLPPLAGFYVKLNLLVACISCKDYFSGFYAFFFSIVLSVGYLRIIRLIFTSSLQTSYEKESVKNTLFILKERTTLVFFLLLIFTLPLIIFPFAFFNVFTNFFYYLALILTIAYV